MLKLVMINQRGHLYILFMSCIEANMLKWQDLVDSVIFLIFLTNCVSQVQLIM
jgi:hypothetical protein